MTNLIATFKPLPLRRAISASNSAARSAVIVSSTLHLGTAGDGEGAMKLGERGIYTLGGIELVVVGRPDVVIFLFTPHNWGLHEAVAYRLSHGRIFERGNSAEWTGEDFANT